MVFSNKDKADQKIGLQTSQKSVHVVSGPAEDDYSNNDADSASESEDSSGSESESSSSSDSREFVRPVFVRNKDRKKDPEPKDEESTVDPNARAARVLERVEQAGRTEESGVHFDGADDADDVDPAHEHAQWVERQRARRVQHEAERDNLARQSV